MQAGESLPEGQEKANDVLPQPDVQSDHHAGVPGHRADGSEAVSRPHELPRAGAPSGAGGHGGLAAQRAGQGLPRAGAPRGAVGHEGLAPQTIATDRRH
eukprot:1288303-Pyramimonas_sp.AAC.1